MKERLTDECLSLVLLCSAVLMFIAAATLLYRFSDGFSESLLETESGKIALAVLFAAVMLIAANFVYQLVIKFAIPFSRPMLIGYVACEVLYSGFMFALQV
jgi:multisubunit Na+/H+ antiporter MnhG subunit